MHILGRIETGGRAVGRACGDDRDLPVERHEAFEDQRHLSERDIGAGRIVGSGTKDALALAVVAEPAGLEHAGSAEFRKGGLEVGLAVDGMVSGGGDAAAVDEALLGETVLCHFQRLRRRKDRPRTGELLGAETGTFSNS